MTALLDLPPDCVRLVLARIALMPESLVSVARCSHWLHNESEASAKRLLYDGTLHYPEQIVLHVSSWIERCFRMYYQRNLHSWEGYYEGSDRILYVGEHVACGVLNLLNTARDAVVFSVGTDDFKQRGPRIFRRANDQLVASFKELRGTPSPFDGSWFTVCVDANAVSDVDSGGIGDLSRELSESYLDFVILVLDTWESLRVNLLPAMACNTPSIRCGTLPCVAVASWQLGGKPFTIFEVRESERGAVLGRATLAYTNEHDRYGPTITTLKVFARAIEPHHQPPRGGRLYDAAHFAAVKCLQRAHSYTPRPKGDEPPDDPIWGLSSCFCVRAILLQAVETFLSQRLRNDLTHWRLEISHGTAQTLLPLLLGFRWKRSSSGGWWKRLGIRNCCPCIEESDASVGEDELVPLYGPDVLIPLHGPDADESEAAAWTRLAYQSGVAANDEEVWGTPSEVGEEDYLSSDWEEWSEVAEGEGESEQDDNEA